MASPFDVLTTILPAVLLERALGTLPEETHPLDRVAELAKEGGMGGGMSGIISGVLFAVLRGVVWIGRKLPRPLGWVMEAVLLYLVLSPSKLAQTAEDVKTNLERRDLASARVKLAELVTDKDVSLMDEKQMAEAAIEAVAVQTVSAVTGPLFYYVTGGVPAAWNYYYVNKATHDLDDAQIRDGLNFAPARLTAFLMMVAAEIRNLIRSRHNIQGYVKRSNRLESQSTPLVASFKTWQSDQELTADPNSGQTVSAMAGGVGVQLGAVGESGRPANPEDIRAAVRIMQLTAGLFVALYGLVRFVMYLFRGKEPQE